MLGYTELVYLMFYPIYMFVNKICLKNHKKLNILLVTFGCFTD